MVKFNPIPVTHLYIFPRNHLWWEKSWYFSLLIVIQNGNFQIVEFISVLLTFGSEAADKELIQQGAIKHILHLFFE